MLCMERVLVVVAYVRELALRPSELGHLIYKHAVFVLLYPALPIRSACGDDNLLSIRRHGPVKLALAVNI